MGLGTFPMKTLNLDELDKKIIERLALNARVSNREIARDLAVAEGTIRARLKRLHDEKIIRVSTIVNLKQLRKPLAATLWIDVESAAHIPQVAAALAALHKIVYVAKMLGRCDIVAVTLIADGDQLTRFIHETIDQIPGVQQVRYTLAHEFIKHDYRWTMII